MDVLSIIIYAAFIIPIILGVIRIYSTEKFKDDFMTIVKFIVFGASIVLGFMICKKYILYNHSRFFTEYVYGFIKKYLTFVDGRPLIIYLIAAPILAVIIYGVLIKIIDFIFGAMIFSILDRIGERIEGTTNIKQRFIGILLSIPKAVLLPLVISLGIYVSAKSFDIPKLQKISAGSEIHNKITTRVVIPFLDNEIIKSIPKAVESSFKIDISKVEDVFTDSMVIYYNGVTLEDGIESNTEVNDLTQEICKGSKSEKEMALKIYEWIVMNMEYDSEKAEKILNDDCDTNSGALEAFFERKGVCFDFACLFVAMARNQGLSVRMIAGKGFNGNQWIDHSWNEVYLTAEDKWISVDTTFGLTDNYFDTIAFNMDHKDRRVIGEWISN